ncbi:MAG: hypothetical protein FWB75_08120 [Oscillospiraceae bacterium]|nr:hypothetical protein [Oscillospiraceae bacterium]
MSNYDDLKAKAKSAFATLADVSIEAKNRAKDKSRILAKKAKLNAGIANERATIRRLNVEIGAKYYNLHKDNPDEALRTQCEEITEAYERIAAKQAELEELKTPCPTEEPCGAECCDDTVCTDPGCTDPECADPACNTPHGEEDK